MCVACYQVIIILYLLAFNEDTHAAITLQVLCPSKYRDNVERCTDVKVEAMGLLSYSFICVMKDLTRQKENVRSSYPICKISTIV